VVLPLDFPAGVAPGEGKQGNVLVISRDGMDRPVLRGTALAGALRHAWAAAKGKPQHYPEVGRWFGRALEDEMSSPPSPLRVGDSVVETGEVASTMRTHNAVDRHTGAVLEQGLFSIEALPPGSRTDVVLWLHDDGAPAQAREFLAEIVSLVRAGLTLGGHTARGIGRVVVDGAARYRHFDCSDLDQQAAYLDEHHAWRGSRTLPAGGEDLASGGLDDGATLSVSFVLTVPRGEDLLVGDGQGLDCEIEPQRVRGKDGSERWRLPGSALRGVFRGWIARLAARAGQRVADSHARHTERRTQHLLLKGDDLAWGFDDPQVRKERQDRLAGAPDTVNDEITCPVMRLFGSSYAKGRLHIADALSERTVGDNHGGWAQRRAHVAVDRITGGANEGFFFSSDVLAGPVCFPVSLTVQRASETEARWLAATLRALHVGILRVGSSKAGGRLALAARPVASGPHKDLFTSIGPQEN